MSARTGLREPWVSNHPGPPGPLARKSSAKSHRCPDAGDTDAAKPAGEHALGWSSRTHGLLAQIAVGVLTYVI